MRALSEEDRFRHKRFITFSERERDELIFLFPLTFIGLVSEVIPEKSCLIFCASKKNCENVALMLCRHMPG